VNLSFVLAPQKVLQNPSHKRKNASKEGNDAKILKLVCYLTFKNKHAALIRTSKTRRQAVVKKRGPAQPTALELVLKVRDKLRAKRKSAGTCPFDESLLLDVRDGPFA
jgi:hypothetical protein